MLPIVEGILKGDKRSISRAISTIDNDEPDSRGIIQEIFNKTGGGRTIGFTGAGVRVKVRLLENWLTNSKRWVTRSQF